MSLDLKDLEIQRKRKRPEPYRAGPYCPSCGQPIKYKNKDKKLHGYIYRTDVDKMMDLILGAVSKSEAAQIMGISPYTVYEIREKRVKMVRKDTAGRIVKLYKEITSA